MTAHDRDLSGLLGGRVHQFEFESEKHVPASVRKLHSVAVNHILWRTKDIDHIARLIFAETNTWADGTYQVADIKTRFMRKVSSTHGQFFCTLLNTATDSNSAFLVLFLWQIVAI